MDDNTAKLNMAELLPDLLSLIRTTCDILLCDRCQFVLHGHPDPFDISVYSKRPHHPSEQSLVQAAHDGCCICRYIVRHLRSLTDDGSFPKQTNPFGDLGHIVADDRFTVCMYHYSNPRSPTTTIDLFEECLLTVEMGDYSAASSTSFVIVPKSPTKDIDMNGVLSKHNGTGSQTSWSQALVWLSDCLQNHTRCRRYQKDEPWYPSRLIDVGHPMESTVKIVCKSTTSLQGPYLTLSHSWGNGPTCRLKTENVDEFQRAISLSSLPKTFQEAIDITRRLEIRYLWIDSMCIIQDSKADWDIESPQMQAVYTYSHLNIAATASENSQQGLFRQVATEDQWPWFTVVPCWFSAAWPCLIYPTDSRARELNQAPLIQRAWVVQERVLAPRLLHFCQSRLIWECEEREACEMIPDQILPHVFGGNNFLDKTLDSETFEARFYDKWGNGNISSNPSVWPYLMWNRIVQRYMDCGITFPSDKLIAISGLAKHMARTMESEYMAGIWRSRIPQDLLWRVNNCAQSSGLPSYRPVTYRAPSWSWASVEASIISENEIDSKVRDCIEVKGVEVTLAHAGDSFGSVADGLIRLRGSLIAPLRVTRSQEWGPNSYKILVHGLTYLENAILRPDVPFGLESKPTIVSCLPIYSIGDPSDSYHHVDCLLVMQARRGCSNTYERWGYGSFSSSSVKLFEVSLAGEKIRAQIGCTMSEETITLV